MKYYRKTYNAFIAIEENRVIASSRTAKDFASSLYFVGRSASWFSRKFSNNNTFVHLVGERVIYFHKVVI